MTYIGIRLLQNALHQIVYAALDANICGLIYHRMIAITIGGIGKMLKYKIWELILFLG